jgi:hypothetical protein
MKKSEMVKLLYLNNDDQLDEAIAFIDEHFKKCKSMDDPDLLKLTDLIWEYEERTDILNRKFRI